MKLFAPWMNRSVPTLVSETTPGFANVHNPFLCIREERENIGKDGQHLRHDCLKNHVGGGTRKRCVRAARSGELLHPGDA